MIKVGKYFTFDDMTATNHADLLQRNKIEANSYTPNMLALGETLLNALVERFGAFIISSGFRGPSLNTRVGGSKTSQHCVGQAADCVWPGWTWELYGEAADWLSKESGLKFGQVIREKHGDALWLHVSTGEKCQALDYVDGKYTERV